MSKLEVAYVNMCIKEFGDRFSISRREAYAYLRRYEGISFLIEFYDVEHLQSTEETLDDLVLICKKNGGSLE